MGQYHTIGNLDKLENLSPEFFGDGVKLWEISASSYGVKSAFAFLMADQWAGDRIAVIGDYTEEGHINKNTGEALDKNNIKFDSAYSCFLSSDCKSKGTIMSRMKDAFDVEFKQSEWTSDPNFKSAVFKKDYNLLSREPFKYPSWHDKFKNCIIYNSDKNEYLDFGSKSLHSIAGGEESIMAAYLYLLATSNNCGSGDLDEFGSIASGSWAGDKTGIVSKQLHCDFYTKIKEDGKSLDLLFPDSFKLKFKSDHYNSRSNATIMNIEKNKITKGLSNKCKNSFVKKI